MSIGRRELFKLAGVASLSLFFLGRRNAVAAPAFRPSFRGTPDPGEGEPPFYATPDGPVVSETGLILDDRTAIALAAAEAAIASIPGPYSWEEYRQCSTFISAYLEKLGLPISDKTERAAVSSGMFPWSGTLRQVKWLRQNLPSEYIHDEPLIDFLNGKLWDEILPGEVVYLTRPGAFHNGYDTYYHVAALVGYQENGQPQFSELAAGMRSASVERTFAQLTRFYKRQADGSWNIIPSNPKNKLVVTWFDPLAVIRDFT